MLSSQASSAILLFILLKNLSFRKEIVGREHEADIVVIYSSVPRPYAPLAI